MSMREFCRGETVTCETKENVKVNSVLSHLWNDESHGENNDVELTMFDARHPKTLQQGLHRVIALRRRVFTM